MAIKAATASSKSQSSAVKSAPAVPAQDRLEFNAVCSRELTPVQDFMRQNGFTQVAGKVRENSKGYPFITFITADNRAQNIYFSKNASSEYSEGDVIARGFFSELQVRMTTNLQGEDRIKLCGLGESTRVEANDLF